MVTRRNDARRRRVLSEEFVPTDENAVAGGNKPMRAYSFGANRRNQPKTTDLIPKRAMALTLFFLMLGTMVAGLNSLALNADSLVNILGEKATRSFALFGPGTLANWLCCMCLFLSSGICLQLFLLRKHKRDDYGGMYRVWILMALMFGIASVDCAIDLRTTFAKLFEYFTSRSLLQTAWLMMSIEMIVLAVIVIRMLFEVRASKLSLASVLMVWAGFVGCIVLRNVHVPESMAWLDQNMAYGNCALLGCVGSLATLTVYSRFVFLHAHGFIQLKTAPEKQQVAEEQTKAPAAKAKKAKKPSVESKVDPTPQPVVATQKQARKTKKATPETSTPVTPTTKKVVQQKVVTQPATSAKKKVAQPPKPAANPDSQEQIEAVPLSKSERRRQRKLAKRAARAKKAA